MHPKSGAPGFSCVGSTERTVSLRTSVATLVWPFPRIPSGHNPPDIPRTTGGAKRLPLLIKGSCPSAHTGAEGIRTPTFWGTRNKARFYNPSVSRLREMREPAPFTQGSRGCSRTSTFLFPRKITEQYPATPNSPTITDRPRRPRQKLKKIYKTIPVICVIL